MPLDDVKTLAERILRLENKFRRIEERKGKPKPEVFDNSAIRNRKIIDDLLDFNYVHGNLSGLDADDHTQYLNTTRHDTTDRHTLGTVVPHDDHGSLSGLDDDDHTQYLLRTDKAADSDKLDGVHLAAFLGLNDLADPDADRVLFWDDSAGALKWLTLGTGLTITDTSIKPSQPQFYPLTTPKTSTSWDGDSFSTTSKTLIDLSSVFGVPAGVKAVYVQMAIRDSASSTTDAWIVLGADNTAGKGINFGCGGLANDMWARPAAIVPCNTDGDIYYQINASGTSTFDVYLFIWGYWL